LGAGVKFLIKAKELYRGVIVKGVLAYYIFRNPKTPWYVRLLSFIPIIYVLIPTDVITDAIPILGQLDDVGVLAFGYLLFLKIVPKAVLEECQQRVRAKLDLKSRKSFKIAAVITLLVILLVIFGMTYLVTKCVATR
jgi:uncharacterized membrane protein YkvA (DUF1232 family)